jgi:23S rRNA (uracil1939-C5)-methyltransferase
MSGTATVEKIVYGGWGLAHHDGKALFLPCTAPGDTVEFTVIKEKKNVRFGRMISIVEPSPQRIDPRCPVFGACGGCHFLHVSYEDELALKRLFVLENLERIGRIAMELGAVIPSPERTGYRNNALFKVDTVGRAGFTKLESTEIIPFPPEGCLLLPAAMREAISALPHESLPRPGDVRARSDRAGEIHFWGLVDRVGPPDLLMEAGGFTFPVAPESFFQVSRSLNDRLLELVLSLPKKPHRRLLDLYCGTGFFTLPLSRLVTEAIGVESDPAAHRSAAAACRLNKVTNVRFLQGTVENRIAKLREADLVIADPPRSGISERALGEILRLRPSELIIVSCEPPTFARDASRLVAAGYIPAEIALIDLFPATYHVETVALFRRS